jgi:hypothetical protein
MIGGIEDEDEKRELKSREKLIRMGGSDDRRYRDGSEGGTAEGWRWRRNNSGPKMHFK